MTWVENATPEVDAQSQWQTILGVCISLSILSITVVSTRLWIRGTARGLASDDYMAALSMVFALIYSILCIVRKCIELSLLSCSSSWRAIAPRGAVMFPFSTFHSV